MGTKKAKIIRILGLIVVFVGIAAFARWMGWHVYFEPNKIRDLINAAGPWGFPVYVGFFSAGELAHVPGMVFVAAGVFAYGKLIGGILAYIGAILAVTISFAVVRGVGGSPLTEIKLEFVKKILASLDKRPVTVIILLRLCFWLAPFVNYALALSAVRMRDFVLGSAIGLIAPITLAVLAFDWAIKTFLG